MADRAPVQALAEGIVKARDALLLADASEAYHALYWAAAELSDDPLNPWKQVEALSGAGT